MIWKIALGVGWGRKGQKHSLLKLTEKTGLRAKNIYENLTEGSRGMLHKILGCGSLFQPNGKY